MYSGSVKRKAHKGHGYVKIKLLTGKKFFYHMPGPPPSTLVVEMKGATEGERGSRIICRRSDIEEYTQMSLKELVKAGIVKAPKKEEKGAESVEGKVSKPGD